MDERIGKKYSIQRRLGKGAYGIVWKAVSKRSKRIVAIKKIFDAFRNATDAQRTFREIVYLSGLRDHPNVIRLLNVHRADNDADLYLVFEFMETDLNRVIRHRQTSNESLLKPIHVEFILFQMLRALAYIHSAGIIHRDLKPSNVLLDRFCNCKIADFGLARSIRASVDRAAGGRDECSHDSDMFSDYQGGEMTDYVATRWYRAPEILVGSKRYSKAVDVWSTGCILGEMMSSSPLFTGSDTADQLKKIERVIKPVVVSVPPNMKPVTSNNTPLSQMILHRMDACSSRNNEDRTNSPRQNEWTKQQKDHAVDLIKKMLSFDPDERIKSSEAIQHSYLSRFFDKSRDLLVRLAGPIVPPLSDNVQLTVNEYRERIYEFLKRSHR